MDPNLESTSEESSTFDEANTATPLDAGENQEAASDSSPGADGKETVSEAEFDPLSAVNKVLGEDKPKEGDGEGQSEQSDGSSQSENDGQKKEDEAELGDVTEEELKGYKPTTRRRIEGLLDDRQRLTERVQALEPAAEQMETLQNFMQERSLTPQNVSELMVVGGLAMSDDDADVRAAINRTEQFLGQLKARLGEVLPADLQAQVDDGMMTEAGAKEVALSRIRTQRADARVQNSAREVENANQRGESQATVARAQVVYQTISDWQSQKAATDPDYQRKATFLQDEIERRVLREGGRILDPQKALQIAEESYKKVSTLVSSLSPQKPEAKKVLHSKAGSSNMASKPSSALDATNQALANMRK